jgi:hypothetical protein
MPTKEAIFIFTKDRPETLEKTLNSIDTVSYTKFIIDDSITNLNQKSVSELCNKYPNCVYLGKIEFNQFINLHHIEFPEFNFLLREIGNTEWNLGYARNFALIYSKALRLERVLFMDDDIQVPNLELIGELFRKIDYYQFVGANILGLVDDSALGHIATDVGINNERMLSGGFMVFKPNSINHFFLNNYNEDWIWLFLQLRQKQYLQTGDVFQELTDPLINYKNKVVFQEFGEIALDGVLDLFKQDSYDLLVEFTFWQRLVKERREYLDTLISKADSEGKENYVEIIEWIKSSTVNFNAELFSELFKNYFLNRTKFMKLYNSI